MMAHLRTTTQKNMKSHSRNRESGAVVILALAAVFLIGLLVWVFGASNVETPAGYVGYVRQGAVLGKTKFIGLQTGPTSSGKCWMYNVQNVCITPYTENEVWNHPDTVLAKDKLPIALSAHLVWKLKAAKVKEFMEQYGGLDEDAKPDAVAEEAYKHFIRQPFRNIVRDEISKFNGLEINEHLPEISKQIFESLAAQLNGSPFELINAFIGSCIPPTNVTEQIALKVAAKQELERKATELEIAQKKEAIQTAEGKAAAAKEYEESKGKAQAIAELKKQLTPEYLTYEAIKGMSGAERVYIPTGASGLPIIGSLPVNTDKK